MSGPRLLADENCWLALVPACRRLERVFPLNPSVVSGLAFKMPNCLTPVWPPGWCLWRTTGGPWQTTPRTQSATGTGTRGLSCFAGL